MVASGNDFVIIENSCQFLAKNICDRKYGIGADGLLVLEKSKRADIRMRIFNADGSEAEMCGNGARCVAYVIARSRRRLRGEAEANQQPIATGFLRFARNRLRNLKRRDCFTPSGFAMTIETKVGIIGAEVKNDNVKIKLTPPKNIKLDIPLKVNNRTLKVNFIDTGVPHAVIFAEGLSKMDILPLGRTIRFHKNFSPKGANVNFIEVLNKNSIKVRTYERGVEGETLACGTGSAASALIFAAKTNLNKKVYVRTQGNEILSVYFSRQNNKFTDVWLEGKVKIVYEGEYFPSP